MIKCSFRIPIKSWRFKDDIWDYMTLESWISCRGRDCNHFKQFEDDLSRKLNHISIRNNNFVSLWFLDVVGTHDFKVDLYSSKDDMSLPEFLKLIHEEIFPIFNNVTSMDETLLFTPEYFDRNQLKIEFSDKMFQ